MKQDKPNIFQRLLQWIRGLSKLKLTALIVVIVLLCMGSAGALYLRRLSNMDKVFKDIDWGNQGNNNDNLDMDSIFEGRKIINIALLGHDGSDARSKTRKKGYIGLVDTIMVAAINLNTAEVDLVSIPRDSLVTIYNQGSYKDKINSANYWGWLKDRNLPMEERVAAGIRTQIGTISSVLGNTPIHYYFAVNLDSVEELIDIVGGVHYDVPKDVYSRRGQLLVEKGYQKLNGRKFMYYARDRLGSSDAVRAGNQQEILISAFNEFKKAKTLVQAPKMLLTMNNEVKTNLSLEQIMALALFASKEINAKDIRNYVLEGHYASGGIPGRVDEKNDYFLLDHPKRVKLIKEIWGIDVEPGPPDKVLKVITLDPPADESDIPSGDSNDKSSEP